MLLLEKILLQGGWFIKNPDVKHYNALIEADMEFYGKHWSRVFMLMLNYEMGL